METRYQREFINFQEHLKSFLFRLLINKADVEDVYQITYVKVHDKIDSFNNESSFKTWVFSIALNTAKNLLHNQNRWHENAQDYAAKLHAQSPKHLNLLKETFASTPDEIYEIKEHISHCFNCITKTLELEQQICLWLKEVYDFKISEIMEISNLSEGKVKHALANARKNMIRIFDQRCALVNKNGTCTQCTTLTGVLNQSQEAHIRYNKSKMARAALSDNQEHLLNLRVDLTKNVDPYNAPNSELNFFMLESMEGWVEEGKRKEMSKIRPK